MRQSLPRLQNVTYVFMTVTNPFRRVLSNAAWSGLFNQSMTPLRPTPQHVASRVQVALSLVLFGVGLVSFLSRLLPAV